VVRCWWLGGWGCECLCFFFFFVFFGFFFVCVWACLLRFFFLGVRKTRALCVVFWCLTCVGVFGCVAEGIGVLFYWLCFLVCVGVSFGGFLVCSLVGGVGLVCVCWFFLLLCVSVRGCVSCLCFFYRILFFFLSGFLVSWGVCGVLLVLCLFLCLFIDVICCCCGFVVFVCVLGCVIFC